MDARLPIALREKYLLVHVPSRRRCIQWADRCGREIANGVPMESAGIAAARATFPYEAKERPNPAGSEVETLLAYAREDG